MAEPNNNNQQPAGQDGIPPATQDSNPGAGAPAASTAQEGGITTADLEKFFNSAFEKKLAELGGGDGDKKGGVTAKIPNLQQTPKKQSLSIMSRP